MKLLVLGIILIIGFPLGLYLLVGPEAFEDADIVLGMLGVGAALFIMGCLFTAKNVLSFFFDVVLIFIGAFLLLIGAFARPLGLLDDETSRDVEQRVMPQQTPTQQQPADEDGGQPSGDAATEDTTAGDGMSDGIGDDVENGVGDESDGPSDRIQPAQDAEHAGETAAPDADEEQSDVEKTEAEGLQRFSEEQNSE